MLFEPWSIDIYASGKLLQIISIFKYWHADCLWSYTCVYKRKLIKYAFQKCLSSSEDIPILVSFFSELASVLIMNQLFRLSIAFIQEISLLTSTGGVGGIIPGTMKGGGGGVGGGPAVGERREWIS